MPFSTHSSRATPKENDGQQTEKMSSDALFQYLFLTLIVVVIIGAIMYMYPGFPYNKSVMIGQPEGFTTIALDPKTVPSCLARDADAQALLGGLYALVKTAPPASAAAEAYDEFKLIVQKLVCMDADITSLGAGEYASLLLPFNTHHDMEPVGTFVGRCLKNAVRERDIDLTLGKLEDRGIVLLKTFCNDEKAEETFEEIVERTKTNISRVCLKEHASMDIPASVRDPGFYTPPDLQQYGPYQNTAPTFNFN
jgi:hypothetical protein